MAPLKTFIKLSVTLVQDVTASNSPITEDNVAFLIECIISVSQNLAKSLKFHHNYAPGRAFGHDAFHSLRSNSRVLSWSLSFCLSSGGSFRRPILQNDLQQLNSTKQSGIMIIWCIFLSLLIGQGANTWPANNCLKIMVCSYVLPSKCVAANNILLLCGKWRTVSLRCQFSKIQGGSEPHVQNFF